MYILILLSLIAVTTSAQELTILHLNDTHSHIDPERSGKHIGQGGVIEQAAFIDSVRVADGRRNVILLHAGDFGQGSSYFTELNGDIEVDVINAMQYDAVTLGNHEFDNGMEELARRIRNLEVPVVCANYDFTGSPLEGLVKPYVVVKKAGKRIGIIGVLTDVSTVVDRSVADKMKYLNPVETTNTYAEHLKNEKKCDLIICLSHLGYDRGEHTEAPLLRGGHSAETGQHGNTGVEACPL